MYLKIIITVYLILILLSKTLTHATDIESKRNSSKLIVYEDEDNGKSSLVFVFDTTGSMHNDLKQLREGAEMILNTALEESDVIEDFVFVPFHDPAVGPATVTRHKEVFKSALNIVRVYGGGDCPEKSLGGIQLALNVSRPRSFVYVFTDATASDHRFVGKVLDAVQRKQSQVVFVLTGHCNDLHKPHYKVYQQIAAASSGQVFNLNKTNVHKVLDFVRSSIRGRTVNLGSAVNKAERNYTQGIPIDSTLGEVTVSVSGAKPTITVVNPSGEQLTGPPKLVTTLDLSEILVVKVLQPEPGNWTITTGSDEDFSVKVVGLSNLTFHHGFSVSPPASLAETSYRPLQGAYNHMMLSLTQTDRPVQINYAEILTLEGSTLFEVPLREVDNMKKIYLSDSFVPPDDFFYIAINGHDEYNQDLRRIGATAVQAKPPDVPYLTVPRKIEARVRESMVLTCVVESIVPVTASWTKDGVRVQQQIASLQSTSIEYMIDAMSEENVGSYRCVAKNVAGVSEAATEVLLIVDPPQVRMSPENLTLEIGQNLTISCIANSDALLLKSQILYENGSFSQCVTDVHLEPNMEGLYVFNKSILNVNESSTGVYSCIAANRGGQSTQSAYIKVQTEPLAQILGPHSITKLQHTDIQLVCHVENANRLQWITQNGSIMRDIEVASNHNDMYDVTNVTEDCVWSCVAIRGERKVTDSVEITVLIKPQVTIEGMKNITILNGTKIDVICNIIAKPAPRILWHRETETFLNNTITVVQPNIYKSVLTLDSVKEDVRGTYFCFGENSEGIHQDSVTVNVRKKMILILGFTDQIVQLYSQIHLPCRVDSYPPPSITWLHNDTEITTGDNMYLAESNSTLYIERVDFNSLGDYSCRADNSFESLQVEGTLSVDGLESPALSKEPVQRITQKGKSTILTCRVIKGNPKPTISWQYKHNITDEFTTLPINVIMSADNLEVIITNVETCHWGMYRCVAENVVGRDVYDVMLVVQFPPEVIGGNKETKPLVMSAGERVQLSCEAAGVPPPIVVWIKDFHPISYSKNVYLTDTNDLVIEKATERDSGMFTCRATSVLGSLQRNFTLVVYVAPTIKPPDTDSQLEVLEGALVELPCAARGAPRPRVTWVHDGAPVADPRKYIDEFGLRFVANLTDFGEYTCVAKNQYGNASLTFSVFIWVAPFIEPMQPSRNVLIGGKVSIECNAVGFPVPTIMWEFQDQLLTENRTDLIFDNIGYLNITNAKANHSGIYVCFAENIAGVAKEAIYLSVNEPPKILPDDYTGPYIATSADTDLVISCRARGNPRPFIIWSKDNRYLDKGISDSRYDLDIDGTLTIKSPSEELSGEYTCVAKNVVGADNKTVTVQIYQVPERLQAEESRRTVTVLEGSNATIDCPIPTAHTDKVKWYKDATLISTGPLQIANISRANASSFACVASTIMGSIYRTVTVDVEWGPKFVDFGGDLEVVRGEDSYLRCGADAKPPAKTKWFFNSRPLLGEDKDHLKLMNVQLRHTGVYKCVVSNQHATIIRQFTLDVLEPPFISEFDLLDVQLKEGAKATLECIAKGSPTPTVKWTLNNTNWHLLNSSLATSEVTSQSEGLFRCDATNIAGVAHLVYRVAVVTPARIEEVVLYREGSGEGETVVGTAEVSLDSHVRLSCKATGKPLPIIQWIRNGNTIMRNREDISYADLVLDKVTSRSKGLYYCAVSNEGGMDEGKVKVEVLEPPKIFQDYFVNGHSKENVTRVEVMAGQSFSLQCHPYGNPVPEIYWFKDDLPLRFFDDTMVSKDYGEVIQSNEARVEQSGRYACVARNKVGNTTVVYLVDVLVPPPTPKEHAKTVNIRSGKQLNLTCPVEGSPSPNVVWVRHPYTVMSEELPRVQLLNDNYTMIINKTEVQDSSIYSCIMTNKVGTTEVLFTVLVETPPVITGNIGKNILENHIVPLRRSIILKCLVNGNPKPTIRWLKDTQQLSNSLSNIQRVVDDVLFVIWNANTRDAGQYICVAENAAGTTHRRYNVAVQVPGKWSPWSQWSFCNVTCGLGYQHRSRLCQYIDDYNDTFDNSTSSDRIILDDSACKGSLKDRRKCHMPLCEDDESQPRWSMWSKWSVCSASCGAGTQARTRRCRAGACTGDNVQIRKCPGLPKCDFNAGHDPSKNEVFSREVATETNAFIPEAVFELLPETVNTQYATGVEEVYVRPESKYSEVYFEANVTENLDRSYRGSCEAGYSQDETGACQDIDECLLENNLCHSTQVCVNTAGAYRCSCSKGFVALGIGQRCLDINECEQDVHGCEYACVNTAGGYVCACPRHLRLHTDKHRCVSPSYRKQYSYEDLGSEEYLGTVIDFPARYMKTRN